MIGAIPIIAENRIREAIENGEFDHLERAGKPFDDVDDHYDANWWLKRKLQREQLTTEDYNRSSKSQRPASPRTS